MHWDIETVPLLHRWRLFPKVLPAFWVTIAFICTLPFALLGAPQTDAVESLQHACDGGETRSCSNLALLYENGSGVKKDHKKASRLFEKACGVGDSASCTNLGRMYLDGELHTDTARGVQLLQKGCDGNDLAGCNYLGWVFETGNQVFRGIPRDYTKAFQLYQKACDGGNPGGCANLGMMYRDGFGVKADFVKSVQLEVLACDAGDAMGCFNAGYGFLSVHNGPAALALIEKSCHYRYAFGCSILAAGYDAGWWGVPRDSYKAQEYCKQARDLGLAPQIPCP